MADNAPDDDIEFLLPSEAKASCVVLSMQVDRNSRNGLFFK
jgi:hypothetical protein